MPESGVVELFSRKTAYLSPLKPGTGDGILEAIAASWTEPENTVKFSVVTAYTKSGSATTSKHKIGSNATGQTATNGVKSNPISLQIGALLSDYAIGGVVTFNPFSKDVKEKLDKLWEWFKTGEKLFYLGYGMEEFPGCVITGLTESKQSGYGKTNADIMITLQKSDIVNTSGSASGGTASNKKVSPQAEEKLQSTMHKIAANDPVADGDLIHGISLQVKNTMTGQ